MDAAYTDLPDDVKTLQAMIVALQVREVRLRHIIAQLQGWRFSARSEKLSTHQYDLALEDRDIACAEADALADQSEETASRSRARAEQNAPATTAPR